MFVQMIRRWPGRLLTIVVAVVTASAVQAQVRVKVPEDLCDFDILPPTLIEWLAASPRRDAHIRYMLRSCPEIAVQVADLATASLSGRVIGANRDEDERNIRVGVGSSGPGPQSEPEPGPGPSAPPESDPEPPADQPEPPESEPEPPADQPEPPESEPEPPAEDPQPPVNDDD